MAKNELVQLQSLKRCFGSEEWSENSGICSNCKLKNDCGKIAKKKASKNL